jgi:hypothetical protein
LLVCLQRLTHLQKLYHQTLAIRPKLIKLIEKYSQKKGIAPAALKLVIRTDSSQTTSHSSMKSSSRPGGTTRLYWSRPCLTRRRRHITNMPCVPRFLRATRPLGRVTAHLLRSKSRSASTPRRLLKVRLRLSWEISRKPSIADVYIDRATAISTFFPSP